MVHIYLYGTISLLVKGELPITVLCVMANCINVTGRMLTNKIEESVSELLFILSLEFSCPGANQL